MRHDIIFQRDSCEIFQEDKLGYRRWSPNAPLMHTSVVLASKSKGGEVFFCLPGREKEKRKTKVIGATVYTYQYPLRTIHTSYACMPLVVFTGTFFTTPASYAVPC